MSRYMVAVVLTVDAPSYDDALDLSCAVARDINARNSDNGIQAEVQKDYETDNDGQRVLYLHPEDADASWECG